MEKEQTMFATFHNYKPYSVKGADKFIVLSNMSRSALERSAAKAQQYVPQPPPPPQVPQMMYAMAPGQMIYPPGMMMAMPMPMMQPFAPAAPAVEDNEEVEHISNALPMHGNTSNFNINNLLYNNIMENDYFRALYQLRTYHEVLDEIYRSVVHVEPWQTGTARFPSSAFCLMVKFMLMKLTLKQMKGLLATTDNAFVRAIGFLYLRYTCPPTDLWKWVEPYLEDEEVFAPLSDQTVTMTVGAYVTKLLTDMQYYGTTLPRIPVPIERKMKVLLLLLNEKKARRQANLRAQAQGKFAVGTKVRAIYSDEENEPAWYEAVIESHEEGGGNDGSGGGEENKYYVRFPEYGNTEYLDLGDMELLDGGNTTVEEEEGEVEGAHAGETAGGSGAGDAPSSGRGGGRHSEERGEVREDSRRRENYREGDRHHSHRRSGSRDYSRDRSRSRHRHDRRGGGDRRDDGRRHHHRSDDRGGGRQEREDSRDGGRRNREDSRDRRGGGHPQQQQRRGDSRDRSVSGRDRDRSHSTDPRAVPSSAATGGGSSSKHGSTSDLLAKVLQSEREASAAVGKNYGQRPASYKGSLSLKIDRYTVRQKSPPRTETYRGDGRAAPPKRQRSPSPKSSAPTRTEMSAEQIQRMKMLKARYGDASATAK